MFKDDSWRQRALQDMAGGSRVVIAAFLYDDPDIQSTLLSRLRKGGFELDITVDKEAFHERTARRQKPKLEALAAAGGRVFLGKGDGPDGRLHMKVMIIDSRIVYWGTANFTFKSRTNKELMQRLQGPPVQDVVEAVGEVQRQPL